MSLAGKAVRSGERKRMALGASQPENEFPVLTSPDLRGLGQLECGEKPNHHNDLIRMFYLCSCVAARAHIPFEWE